MRGIVSASHDVVFKALFVRNPNILRAFLSDILDLQITDDAQITILNPEIVPTSYDGKQIRLDIHIKMGNRKFNIEMQMSMKGFSPERVVYYWSEIFVEKFPAGGKYEELEKTYSISILNFNYTNSNNYHSSYSILEDKRHEKFTDKLSIHIFELPKVPDKIISGDKKQIWMELIKADNEEALEMIRTKTNNAAVREAVDAVYAINADEILREQIRERNKALRDYGNDIAVAKEEGKENGKITKAIEVIDRLLEQSFTIENALQIAGIDKETYEKFKS